MALLPYGRAMAKEMIHVPEGNVEVAVSKGVVISLPRPASTVFIAEPEIASYQVVTSKKLLIFGRLPGQTSLFAMDSHGQPLYSATISVAYDTLQMEQALKRDFPSLTLKLTPVADGIVVSGEAPSAQVAADVVALLDSFVRLGRPSAAAQGATGSSSDDDDDEDSSDGSSPTGAATGKGTLAARNGKIINRLRVTMPTQVTIRVRVAEVNRNLSEKLGFEWQAMHTGSVSGSSIFFGVAENAITSGALNAATDFAMLIDALAEEELVSVLAEPNLSVISGETANFLAGGQTPFPVSTGDDDVSIEFKDFGVLLGVTPTVLSPQRISLRLRPEVSEPSEAYGITWRDTTVPGFIVRRAETTIEIASGQSFAIGGLLQNSVVNEISKIPGLGDIPVLGALARSTAFQREETELVIIATAYVVEPSDGSLRIPNAKVYVPSAFERLVVGVTPDVSPGSLRPADFIYH
jgi:pilus assembly protein CpaC